MAKHGKKYTAACAKVNFDENYAPKDALKLAKKHPPQNLTGPLKFTCAPV